MTKFSQVILYLFICTLQFLLILLKVKTASCIYCNMPFLLFIFCKIIIKIGSIFNNFFFKTACNATHHEWHCPVWFEHAGPCQTGSVHGRSPVHGAARAGWSAGKCSPGDSKKLSDHYHDARQMRSTWKTAVNKTSKEKSLHNFLYGFPLTELQQWRTPVYIGSRNTFTCAYVGCPYPERDSIFTKSLWPFKGVKRMQVDRANEFRALMMVSFSCWAWQ